MLSLSKFSFIILANLSFNLYGNCLNISDSEFNLNLSSSTTVAGVPWPRNWLDAIKNKLQALNMTDRILESLIEKQMYYCPNVPTCSIDIQPEKSLDSPCCKDCKCSPDCLTEGSCCPDFFLANDLGIQHEICVRANFRKFSFGDHVQSSESSFYMTSRCFDDFVMNKTIQDLCENIHTTPENYQRFLSHVPVTSNITGVVYRNIYCAICNLEKESNQILWDVELLCPENVYIFPESLEILLRFVEKEMQCNLIYSTPIGAQLPTLCDWGKITECNQTGEMISYDKSLDIGCQAYTSLNNVFYRNIHCFMCNVHKEPPINGCDWGEPIDPFDITSFTALLNFHVLEENENTHVSEMNADNRCLWNEEYDPYKDICRHVRCSEGYVLSNKGCKRIYNQELVKSYEVYYRLTSTHHCLPDIVCIGFEITTYLIQKISETSELELCRIDTIQDGDCFGEADALKTLSNLIIHVEFTSKKFHLVESVLKQMSDIQNKTITINSTTCPVDVSKEVHVTIDSYNYGRFAAFGTPTRKREYIDPITLKNLPFMWNDNSDSQGRICSSPMRLVRVMNNAFCPQIVLTKTEYNFTFVDGMACIEEIDFCFEPGYFTNNSDSITVCKEEYMSHISNIMYSNSTTANKSHIACPTSINTTANIITLSIISPSIFCLIVTLTIYCLYTELRTVPGLNNMILSTNLLVAQLLFLFGSGQHQLEIVCKVIGTFLHLFWLSTFFMMNACTIHMVRVFINLTKPNPSSRQQNTCVVVKYLIYSYTCSAVFVLLNIVVTLFNTNWQDIGYGGCICYISTKIMIGITFALPAGLIILSNITLFIIVIISLQRLPNGLPSNGHHRNNFIIYIKLSCLTGVTWVFGFLNEFFPLDILSYIFIVLNAGQGLYIMLAFVCNERVINLIKTSCRNKKEEGSPRFNCQSNGNTTPNDSATSSRDQTATSNISSNRSSDEIDSKTKCNYGKDNQNIIPSTRHNLESVDILGLTENIPNNRI